MSISALLLGLLLSVPALATGASPHATESPSVRSSGPTPAVCKDFAERQVSLADRLLRRSNYSRAVKVLNSTLNNCKQDFVQEKLFEVLQEWYQVARQGSTADFQTFITVLSDQQYVTPGQRSRLEQQIQSHLLSLVAQKHKADDPQSIYRLCRQYPMYITENFRGEYYCGTAALNLDAEGMAMSSYAWLLENWDSDQSLSTWGRIADDLESMYLLNGRFQGAYELARRMAVRNPTPKAIIASLVSIRGNFLAPLMRVASHFYEDSPEGTALAHVDREMQRVDFPKYVRAFYILGPDQEVQRGMYGSEATKPAPALLEQVSGSVSLLQTDGESNVSWLVSPIGDRHLVLEFGVATTAEENVRLENVQQQVRSDRQWEQLYQLEFTQTYPASGSAIGTVLGASLIGDTDFGGYERIFDDSPILSYYCIQNDSEGFKASYNFNRSNLGYGEGEWERTSNTPALYHHTVQYDGRSIREVVWPNFVDEQWTGVIRVGLVQS
jgi:hypothetical protein